MRPGNLERRMCGPEMTAEGGGGGGEREGGALQPRNDNIVGMKGASCLYICAYSVILLFCCKVFVTSIVKSFC